MSGFRDKKLIDRIEIENENGVMINTILKNTNILIIKDYNVTSKLIKTKELGIKIYTKEEFEKLYFILDISINIC